MEKIDDLQNEIISGLLNHYEHWASADVNDLEEPVFEGSNFWAYQVMGGLINGKPEIAWQILLEVIQKTNDEEILGLIGAGELEDLIREHPHLVIDRIEIRAQSDIKFKKVLSNVDGGTSIPVEILERIDNVRILA